MVGPRQAGALQDGTRSSSPCQRAEAWQMSNAPVSAWPVHRASLDLFDEAGMDRLREKSVTLDRLSGSCTINASSRDEGATWRSSRRGSRQRGCQLSILAHDKGRSSSRRSTARGVMVDWREPNVMRMAPVPLYNTLRGGLPVRRILRKSCDEEHHHRRRRARRQPAGHLPREAWAQVSVYERVRSAQHGRICRRARSTWS
jgi:hypothetical protein